MKEKENFLLLRSPALLGLMTVMNIKHQKEKIKEQYCQTCIEELEVPLKKGAIQK